MYANPNIQGPIQQNAVLLALGSGATLGADIGALVDLSGPRAYAMLVSGRNALTAFAGGGQNSSTPLEGVANTVSTVANPNDSGVLPSTAYVLSGKAMVVIVVNAGSNAMNVFPAVGDAVNALGANVAYALAAGKAVLFVCTLAGQWYTILSA